MTDTRLRDGLACFLAGVLVTVVAATYYASVQERRTEALADSVRQERAARMVAEAAVDSARAPANLASLAVETSTPGWDAERRALQTRARTAERTADELRVRLDSVVAPDVRVLLDSLHAAHEAETAALHGRIRSQREEIDALWTERTALHRLVERQDSALAAALREIQARETLETALRRQIRPSLWSRAIGDFSRGLLVGGLAGYVLASR